MNLLIDIDGTVADLGTEWLGKYNLDYNDTLTNDDILNWNTHTFVKPECGTKIYDYLSLPDLYDNVKPIPGALEVIGQLRQEGHRIIYVTSGLYPAKIEWLFKRGFMPDGYIGWASSPDFVIAHDKSLIRGDLLVDDKPENVYDFNPDTSILFDQPWNREAQYLTRARGWSDVYSIISEGRA